MPPTFTQLRVSAEHRPISKSESLILWIVGLAFTSLIAASLLQQFVPQKLSIVFFVVFWFAMLVLHEAGHAAMAKAVGWRVSEMVIGFGPEVWRGRIGETRVRLHIIPVEGYVLPGPVSGTHARLKSALVYAAGPGIELLVLALLIGVFGWDTVFNHSTDIGLIALKTLAIVIVWGAGFNLLPFTTQGGVSDGLGILLSPFMSDATIERRVLGLELREIDRLENLGRLDEAQRALEQLRERYAGNLELALRYVRLLATSGQHAAARSALNGLLDGRAIVDVHDVALLHTTALVEMAQPDANAMNVDLAINRALQLAPDDATLLITKAAALIARGRAEDGGNLIADVFLRVNNGVDRARALGYLTVAAKRCRQDAAAQRFRSAFEHVNASRPLRAWVDDNMSA